MKSTITVLIPTYNAGHYLREALHSVFTQTISHWQIIVIDDASTDNSINLARDYFTDSRVTLLHNPKNLGQSKSLNRGLALSQTAYTVQLDSDDWFNPDTLETLYTTAENSPDSIALFSGNLKLVIENADGKLIQEEIWQNRSFKERYDFMLANCSQWPRFYRTAALKEIGGWPIDDPYEGRYMEDKRVLFRLIENYEFLWLDHVLYNHRRHSGNQTRLTQIYNEMTEWTICDALKRWGNQFEPIFKHDIFGRMRLVNLSPKECST